MKTILVPVDFSEVTARVVETAAALAAAFGDARLILLHVAEPEPEFVGFDPGPPGIRMAVASDVHADTKRLAELKEKTSGAAEVLALHVQGSTPREILDLAGKHDAAYIVLGSHGHGALYHLLAGSVADGVLKGARCPVVIVPAGPAR